MSVVDTNVLVYAHLDDAPHHSPSLVLLDLARTDQQAFAVTPQILLEFYAVMTDPRRVSPAFTPAEVQEAIDRLLNFPAMSVLPIPADVVAQTLALATQHEFSGAAVFDVQIVATMLGNGVNRIHTYDQTGFKVFKEITVEVP